MLSLSALCAIPVLAQSDHDQQIKLSREYMQSGRYYEASQIAARLLAIDPNDAEAAAIRDDASSRLKDVLNQRVADAERGGDQLALANAYFDAGRYDAALDLYGKLPASSRDRDVRLREARAMAWSGRFDAAERSYSTLLKEQSSPELQLEYGRLLSWMGATKPAVAHLRALDQQLGNEETAVALANAEAASGNREEAIRLLSDFTEKHADAIQAKALLRELRASPELRFEHINHLIEAEPYNLALRTERARMNLERAHYNEALNDVQFVRENSKNRVEGLDAIEKEARARREQELKSLSARLATLKANDPKNPDEVLSLARAYVGLGDYDNAIALYEQYLAMRPNDTEARIQYARVLSWDRRYAQASRQLETLIEQNPDRADLKLEYAQNLSYDSNFAGALHMFSSLTDLSDNPRRELYSDVPPRAYYNMGQIYRWYGWTEHDVLDQNRALALDSNYTAAQRELDLARHTRPSSTLDARYTYSTDSNDFTLKRADLDAAKWTSQRMAFDVGVGRHQFERLGEEAVANAISGGALYRLNDRTSLRGRIGANFYDHDLGTRPFFGVGATWLPNLQSRAALDFNHYDLVYDVFTLQSLTVPTSGNNFRDPISINDFRGHYDYNGGGLLSYLADASYGFISDDNKRAAAHGVVAFRILKAPFVALKADGRWLSYDFRSNRYWSPNDYHSLAGVAQIGQNIRDRFIWNAEVKYGRSWEGSLSSDLRAYEATATVPVSDAFDIVGNYGYGKSGRLDSVFGNSGTDITNYWQRHWYVGVRVKRLFASDDQRRRNPYYFDNSSLAGSPVLPEVH